MAAVLLQLTWLLDDNGIPANWANMVRSLLRAISPQVA